MDKSPGNAPAKSQGIILIVFLIFFAGIAYGSEVEFEWEPNTEPDLAGYHVYQSGESGGYVKGQFKAQVPKEASTFILYNVPDGKWFWVFTAFDNDGNESDFSNEVTARIDTTPPAPPKGLVARILEIIAELFWRLFS